jgi:ribonuclease PH
MQTRSQQEQQQERDGHPEAKMYGRFAAMIMTSTVVMFLLTYTNVYIAEHIRFSQERLYMAVLMGASMALVMLGFMWGVMYRSVRLNLLVVVIAIALGTTALWMSRSQVLVGDQAYMKAMIPHHSIAILTSERASIEDRRVQDLADEIITAQRREIAEMDWLIEDIERNGPARTSDSAAQRPVPEFTEEP